VSNYTPYIIGFWHQIKLTKELHKFGCVLSHIHTETDMIAGGIPHCGYFRNEVTSLF